MKQQLTQSTILNFQQGLSLVGGSNIKAKLLVDCASGVTGVMLEDYRKMLEEHYELAVINDGNYDRPNEHCGS